MLTSHGSQLPPAFLEAATAAGVGVVTFLSAMATMVGKLCEPSQQVVQDLHEKGDTGASGDDKNDYGGCCGDVGEIEEYDFKS